MAMPRIVNIGDNLRIRRLNGSNVLVERLVQTDGHDPGWQPANGPGRGPFLQTEAGAARWILDHGLVHDDTEAGLEDAVSRYEKAASELEAAVMAAIRGDSNREEDR